MRDAAVAVGSKSVREDGINDALLLACLLLAQERQKCSEADDKPRASQATVNELALECPLAIVVCVR